MDNQTLYPQELKSMMECMSRATLLSQPTDIHEFLVKYMSELISFKSSQPETDPTVVSLKYQAFWENNFLNNWTETAETSALETEMSAGSPQVPSLAQVEEAQKMLYADLASSNATHVAAKVQSHKECLKNTSGKDKNLRAAHICPQPPPYTERGYRRNELPPFLVVTGLGMPAPPNKSIRTRRVASVSFSTEQQRKETTDDKKTQETPLPIRPHPPTLKESLMPLNAEGLKPTVASKSSKLPSVPLSVRTLELTLPDIPQMTTRGGQVSVNKEKVSSKSREQLPRNREVGSEKTSSRKAEHKVRPETAEGRNPERNKKPREPETESTMAGLAKTKIEKLEKDKIRPNSSPNRSPARSRGLRPLSEASLKPVVDVPLEGIQGRAFGRPATEANGTNNPAPVSDPNHTHVHLAHPADIIKYRRMQLRSV